MGGALQDVQVIDFSHKLNGPFCTMLLGHMGAEIIKVEPPEGDSYRWANMPPDAEEDGYQFRSVNVNKKSIVINLKTELGVKLAQELIKRADVLVENYAKGTMERFGLGYESLTTLNPKLIYACSYGFGEWGPYSSYSSTAHNNNAMTGWTHTSWQYSGAPGTKPLGIGDEAGGISMALGILGALHARGRTGEGQKVEISMQEAVMGFMTSSMHEHFTGNDVGSRAMEVADGYFLLRKTPRISNNAWKKLAHLIGKDDCIDDPRFITAEMRQEYQVQLDSMVKDWAQKKSRNEIWEGLRDIAYFGAPVLSIGEVIEDPHIKERQAFIDLNHPTTTPTTLLAPWVHLSKTPTAIHDDAPAIGQHTDEILNRMLGLSMGELSTLRGQGVIK